MRRKIDAPEYSGQRYLGKNVSFKHETFYFNMNIHFNKKTVITFSAPMLTTLELGLNNIAKNYYRFQLRGDLFLAIYFKQMDRSERNMATRGFSK